MGSFSSSHLISAFFEITECGGFGFEDDDCETDAALIAQFREEFSVGMQVIEQAIDFEIYKQKPIRSQAQFLQ